MEIITALLGLLAGYVIGRQGGRQRLKLGEAPGEPELPEIPRRLKIQMDNFMTYDGTARGQKPIEE